MSTKYHAPFWVQMQYTLGQVWAELVRKKYATLLTILVIAVSLTIPTVSFLLWKNVHSAASQFSPESDLTVYLHKNLSEEDSHTVVEKIRQQEGVESLHYVSRQESLKQFKSWSGFNEELDILDDNPLPAVVMITPSSQFQPSEKRQTLYEQLKKLKGVEEVRLNNDWLEKLTALTWLIAHIAIFCTVLMTLAVCLVIANSVRSDVYSSLAKIQVMKLLGATEQFILRPFLYTGIIYGVLGALFAGIFSAVIIGYFTSAVQYVTDIFAVSFNLSGLGLSEMLFLLMICSLIGYISAWITAKKYIHQVEK